MPLERAGRFCVSGVGRIFMVVATSEPRMAARTPDAVPVACPNCKRLNSVYLPFGMAPPIATVFTIEDWHKK
jgi:hypothetical protein